MDITIHLYPPVSKNATTCMKSALGSGLLAANSCVRGPCCSMQISSTKTSCLALRSN